MAFTTHIQSWVRVDKHSCKQLRLFVKNKHSYQWPAKVDTLVHISLRSSSELFLMKFWTTSSKSSCGCAHGFKGFIYNLYQLLPTVPWVITLNVRSFLESTKVGGHGPPGPPISTAHSLDRSLLHFQDTIIEHLATLIEQSITIARKPVGSYFSNIVKVSKITLSELLTCEMFHPHTEYHSHLLCVLFSLLVFHSQHRPPHSLGCSTAPDLSNKKYWNKMVLQHSSISFVRKSLHGMS